MTRKITWNRVGGYECSSKGDFRFSALYALMPDGRTIEMHYQCDIKGHDVGGHNWKLGKGRAPRNPGQEMWPAYLGLWKSWAKAHPKHMEELRGLAEQNGFSLSDRFATTDINQAHALACILNGEDE